MKQDREFIEQLKESFLFCGLPDEELVMVAQKTTPRTLAPGEVLMRRGEMGDSLFMIHTGWVKIVTEDIKGEELVINKCGPGETLGEIALLDKGPRSATVITLTEAEVFELRSDDFKAILDQRPDLAMSLIRGFSSRLRFSTKYIEQAIDWAQRLAVGDYSLVEEGQSIQAGESNDEDKAGQLLSTFFQMARKVKEREDDLKQQLERLTIEIDEVRRKQEFEEIVGTDFYANLKDQARKLRAQRSD